MAKRKKKNSIKINTASIAFVGLALIIAAGVIVAVKKYAPTKERMELTEYFNYSYDDEAVVILNGKYDPDIKPDIPQAIILGGTPYIELSYTKSNLDDGYVYDSEEDILRYATDKSLITANEGELNYTSGRESVDFSKEIVIEKGYGTYLNSEFVTEFTDVNIKYSPNPDRVMIETAGTEKKIATLSKDTAIRRFGGPKSKILKDGIKGDAITILEDYGKWTNILTDDGVIGCVKNSAIGKIEDVETESHLTPREYTHNLLDKKVCMAWHQVMAENANSGLESVLDNTKNLNVISPTWYRLADNNGEIKSISSSSYVDACHNRGIEVWAMVSNFDIEGVDTTSVLNRVSSRDNLVNNIISAAIADKVDGINVDFEALNIDVKDGFIQFIRELSLKCKNNSLILSVANYKPEEYTMFYNRKEQAKYADYVIVMSYDEFHGDSMEAGSNSSLPFVKEAVEDTLKEVPKEQLIAALPFYTREWATDGTSLINQSISMKSAIELEEKYADSRVWLDKEAQYYIKYEKDGKTTEVWIEDGESLSKKLSLIKENDLAGVSFWKLGLEPTTIWDIVANYVN